MTGMPDINYLWFGFGIALIGLEAAGVSGIGLFFGGLGAATTATLIYYSVIGQDAYFTQFVCFLAASVAWALLLWKPIQKIFPRAGTSESYNNIVGETAVVDAPGLHKGKEGHALWSGTRMRAEISTASAAEEIAAGARVKIVDVKGNTLIVDV